MFQKLSDRSKSTLSESGDGVKFGSQFRKYSDCEGLLKAKPTGSTSQKRSVTPTSHLQMDPYGALRMASHGPNNPVDTQTDTWN